MITDETEFLTVKEVAARLRVSRATVWRWIDSGRLAASRVGGRSIRIRSRDVDAIVKPARKVWTIEEMEPYALHTGDPTIPIEEVLARIEERNKEILARRGGKLLPESWPYIREAREERHGLR